MWYLSEIPKVAHFYWDQECLPYLRYLTLFTFSKLNPDWELKLWQPFKLRSELDITWRTEEHAHYRAPAINYWSKLSELSNLTINCIDQKEPLSKMLNGVAFSDLLRWKLLAEEGGLWSDMDIVYLKPITEVSVNKERNSAFRSVVCRDNITFNSHFIGVLMSAPNNDLFQKTLELSSHKFDPDLYQSIGSGVLEDVFTKEYIYFNKNTIGNLFFEDFYLYNANQDEIASLFAGKLSKNFSNAVGIHWYAGSRPGSLACSEYNHLNYSTFKTSFSKILEYIVPRLDAEGA